MDGSIRAVFIDDNPDDRTLGIRALKQEISELQVTEVTDELELGVVLDEGEFDVVITDFRLNWTDGLTILRRVKKQCPDCPVIMFTGTGSEEIAVEAMKAGLNDYVLKAPQHYARLPAAVRRALERAQQAVAMRAAERRFERLFEGVPMGLYSTAPDGRLVSANPALAEMLRYPDRDSLLGVRLADLHADGKEYEEWKSRLKSQDIVLALDVQIRPHDGDTIWVRHSTRVVRDAEGGVEFYEGTMEDITRPKRVESQRNTRSLQQAAVARLGQRALAGLDLGELMDETAALVAETLGVEFAKVLGLRADGQSLLLKAGVGWKKGVVGKTVISTDADTQAGFTLDSGEPVIVEDLRTETRFSGPPLLTKHRVVSGVSVCIQGANHTYGVLGAHTASARTFNKYDVHFLQAMANVLAQATDRKRVEVALVRRERYFRALIENASDAISILDRDGTIRYTSPSMERSLGYKPEEMVGRKGTEFVQPDDGARIVKEFDQAILKRGRPQSLEFRCVAKDGSIRILETVVSLIEGLEAGSILFNSRDVTERRRAEATLRAIVEGTASATGGDFFRTLVETLAHALGVKYVLIGELVDEQATSMHTLAFWAGNDFGENFQYDLKGTPCEKIVGNKARFFPRDAWRQFSDDEMLTELKIECYVGVPLFDSSHNPLGLLAVLHDEVTDDAVNALPLLSIFAARASAELERKHAEEALRETEEKLRHSQKMEAVGRLAGGVAHDFNNLLTAISGYTDLLLRSLDPADPRTHDAKEIRRAGDRAALLTKQLLIFSRRQVLQPEVLNLNAVVGDIDNMLRRLIGEDVELVTIPGENLGNFKADLGQIQQVLINLAVNARDAMPRGGKLTLETRSMKLTAGRGGQRYDLPPGRYLVLEVRDTGVGMSAATLSRIFEPYFTTKSGRGTGLGLSTVYGIVTQSGGAISVESVEGEGTGFRILLPEVDESAPAAAVVNTASDDLRGTETILLVEDEDTVRDVAERILTRHGYGVLSARYGDEAIHIFEEHTGPIDLLLTDVVMPHMSGPQLAHRLIESGSEARVLYMSGYTDKEVDAQMAGDTGVSFLQKPFTPVGLARMVRQSLDGENGRKMGGYRNT